ncbi:unnamed protein product [Durusdinium trenchii]|uniref:Uncharacterized protein n=1 Tax=Durusdinium trenchii TaxID=1381693 RepID=A0ABP0N0H9_9DINO
MALRTQFWESPGICWPCLGKASAQAALEEQGAFAEQALGVAAGWLSASPTSTLAAATAETLRFGSELAQVDRAGLASCDAVAAGGTDHVFVVDGGNHRVMQLKVTSVASAMASSVLLPPAAQLALKGPLVVFSMLSAIYGNDHYELLVGGSRECERNNHGRGNRIAGLPRNSTKILTELDEDPQGQQGEGPLPARLWRVRLSDMQLLGSSEVFWVSPVQRRGATEKRFEINQLTALGSGGSIWVAGDRLLFRLDIATLRSRDYLDLPASWGQVTVITEYGEVLVLGTDAPAVVEVSLATASLATAPVSLWPLTPQQGIPRVAASSRTVPMAILGTDAASPQLLVLPARLTVTLGGAGITALAPVASGVVAATGEGGRMEDAGPMG